MNHNPYATDREEVAKAALWIFAILALSGVVACFL